jgi:curved DNA-binding protein
VPLEAAYSGDSLRITVNGKQLDVRVPKGIRRAR